MRESKEPFYVNAETGDDAAPGTKEKPLRAIPEAARRVTEGKGSGPTTVVVSEGVHALDRTALFKPGRVYTKEARLTIWAENPPGDQDWNPARMPVVISTMPLSKTWWAGASGTTRRCPRGTGASYPAGTPGRSAPDRWDSRSRIGRVCAMGAFLAGVVPPALRLGADVRDRIRCRAERERRSLPEFL